MLFRKILASVTRIYDLVMTHKLDADDLFIHRVQQHCAELGLNFFLVEPLWVEPFCDQFAKGKIWARALLNMHSEHHLPDDIYHRLIWLAHDRKTQIIDPPDLAIGTFDKARLHARLVAAGFNVPFTVIVPREQVNSFVLSEADRAALGTPFVVKPGMGYGRRGVILVTVNYRVGILGFFAHPGLTAESQRHSSGNYGLLDQLAALKWLHDNVARFGGDQIPDEIRAAARSAAAAGRGRAERAAAAANPAGG